MPAAEQQRASRVNGGASTSMVSTVAERMAQRAFDPEREWRARSRGWGELRARVGGAIGGLAPSPPPRGDDGEVEVVTVRAGRQAQGGVYALPTRSNSRDRAGFRTGCGSLHRLQSSAASHQSQAALEAAGR